MGMRRGVATAAAAMLLAALGVTPAAAAAAPGATADPVLCGVPLLGTAFDRSAARPPGTGTVTARVVAVEFGDHPADARDRRGLDEAVRGLRAFVAVASRGLLRVDVAVPATWTRLPGARADYAPGSAYEGHREYADAAVGAAGADLTGADVLVVVGAGVATGLAGGAAMVLPAGDGIPTATGSVDGIVTVGAAVDLPGRVLAHEFLHTLGLPDLYAAEGVPTPAGPDDPFGFTGPFSLMADVAASSPSPTFWEQRVLGWRGDAEARCVTGQGTAVLGTVETSGRAPRAIVAPRPDGTAVVVERRSAAGVDGRGPDGVIAYVVDPRLPGGHGPIRVATRGGSVMSPLRSGGRIVVAGVEVAALAGGRVRVRVPA